MTFLAFNLALLSILLALIVAKGAVYFYMLCMVEYKRHLPITLVITAFVVIAYLIKSPSVWMLLATLIFPLSYAIRQTIPDKTYKVKGFLYAGIAEILTVGALSLVGIFVVMIMITLMTI